jgi:hypothetical protein
VETLAGWLQPSPPLLARLKAYLCQVVPAIYAISGTSLLLCNSVSILLVHHISISLRIKSRSGPRCLLTATQSPSLLQTYLFSNFQLLQLLLIIHVCHFFLLLRLETLYLAFQPSNLTLAHISWLPQFCKPHLQGSTAAAPSIPGLQRVSSDHDATIVSISSVFIGRLECYCHFGKTLKLMMLDSGSCSCSF